MRRTRLLQPPRRTFCCGWRARSAWSGFFDYLVAEDLVEGNPMAAVGKPKLKRDTAKVLKIERSQPHARRSPSPACRGTPAAKLANIVDEHTREALAMRVGRTCGADELLGVIDALVAERGAPGHLRMDIHTQLVPGIPTAARPAA